MGYYEPVVAENKNKNVKLGRKIYMSVFAGRRGFRDDQLGIEDADIWISIFHQLGQLARAAVELEQEKRGRSVCGLKVIYDAPYLAEGEMRLIISHPEKGTFDLIACPYVAQNPYARHDSGEFNEND